MVQYHSRVGRLVSWLVDQVRCGNLISSDHLVISSRVLARSLRIKRLIDWLIDWLIDNPGRFLLSLLSSTYPSASGREGCASAYGRTDRSKTSPSIHPFNIIHTLPSLLRLINQSLTHSLAKTTKVQKKKGNRKKRKRKKKKVTRAQTHNYRSPISRTDISPRTTILELPSRFDYDALL